MREGILERFTKPTGDGAVNGPAMAASLSEATANGSTSFEYELLAALQAIRAGDFSVRMSGEQVGARGRIVETFNEIAAANQRMAQQLERVGQDVGRDGRTRQRVKLGVSSCAWVPVSRKKPFRSPPCFCRNTGCQLSSLPALFCVSK